MIVLYQISGHLAGSRFICSFYYDSDVFCRISSRFNLQWFYRLKLSYKYLCDDQGPLKYHKPFLKPSFTRFCSKWVNSGLLRNLIWNGTLFDESSSTYFFISFAPTSVLNFKFLLISVKWDLTVFSTMAPLPSSSYSHVGGWAVNLPSLR